MGTGYVYIMTNKRHTVVYVGVTSDLVRRVAEHKARLGSTFTTRYNCDQLVYYQAGDDITGAIVQEKRIKNRPRAYKDQLICGMNPRWDDLSDAIGVSPSVVEFVRRERLAEGPSPVGVPRPPLA